MRPSLAPERRDQMLDALAACIVEFGVHGATAERVARRAGWTRGNVRYYLGTKEQQLDALVERLAGRYAAELRSAAAQVADEKALDTVLDLLFGQHWQQPRGEDDALLDQLVAYEAADRSERAPLRAMYEDVAALVGEAVRRQRPGDADEGLAARCFAVVSLAYGAATMLELGLAPAGPAFLRAAGEQLLSP